MNNPDITQVYLDQAQIKRLNRSPAQGGQNTTPIRIDLRDAIFNAINEIQREQPATMRSEDMTAFVLCQLQGMIVWRRAVNSKAQIEGQMQILRNTVAAW